MLELSRSQRALVDRIVDWAHHEDTLRADVTGADFIALIPMVSARSSRFDSPQHSNRYTQLILDGMRATTGARLPGEPPRWKDIERSWRSSAG